VLTKIVGDLLISISHETNENLLRKELRHAPVDMEVDPVLIIRVVIPKIVGETRNRGELCPVAGLK
jgi:hypothetical protein